MSDELTRKVPGGSKTFSHISDYFTVKKKVKTDDGSAREVAVEETSFTAVVKVSDENPWATLEKDTMGPDWYKALLPEFSKPYFVKLKQFLVGEAKKAQVYPAPIDIYSWSRLTPLSSVKVVVVGQDPYHGGQAHGLAFSVLPPHKVPASLKNIYLEMAANVPGFVIPKKGDLTPLAKVGVLWINTSLTVRAHQAASHSKQGWKTFTTAVIKAITTRHSERGVVFLAWGSHAQDMLRGVDKKRHKVLSSAHPSPLSVHKGFLGNQHFKLTNDWLREKYGTKGEINWRVLNEPEPSSSQPEPTNEGEKKTI